MTSQSQFHFPFEFVFFFGFFFFYVPCALVRITLSKRTEEGGRGEEGDWAEVVCWGEGLQLCTIALMQQCSLITHLTPHPGFIPVHNSARFH